MNRFQDMLFKDVQDWALELSSNQHAEALREVDRDMNKQRYEIREWVSRILVPNWFFIIFS